MGLLTRYIQEAKKAIGSNKIKRSFTHFGSALNLTKPEFFTKDKEDLNLLKGEFEEIQNKIISGIISFDEESQRNKALRLRLQRAIIRFENELNNIEGNPLHILVEQTNMEDNPIGRTELIIENLKGLVYLEEYCVIRQKGNLSSFSLPNRDKSHPAWKPLSWPGDKELALKELLAKERYWIEQHALRKSCKLIVNLESGIKTKSARHALYRLKTFLNFLKTHRDSVDIVNISNYFSEYQNLLIVGDWFYAESKIPGIKGLEKTMLSTETAKVFAEIEQFDRDFQAILKQKNMDEYEALEEVILMLEHNILEIQRNVTHYFFNLQDSGFRLPKGHQKAHRYKG